MGILSVSPVTVIEAGYLQNAMTDKKLLTVTRTRSDASHLNNSLSIATLAQQV